MTFLKTILATVLTVAAATAGAAPIYTSFGGLPTANFGGSGIPNDAVAMTTLGTTGIVMGLTATARYDSLPVPTNNGAGVFHAPTGTSTGDNAKWNYDFYIGGATGPSSVLGTYTYQLLVDMDPAVGNAMGTYMDLSLVLAQADSLETPGTIQNSHNLGFYAPFPFAFDAMASGQYGFALRAFNGDVLVGTVAIDVNVGDVDTGEVPEPGSLALAGVALLGLLRLRRKA